MGTRHDSRSPRRSWINLLPTSRAAVWKAQPTVSPVIKRMVEGAIRRCQPEQNEPNEKRARYETKMKSKSELKSRPLNTKDHNTTGFLVKIAFSCKWVKISYETFRAFRLRHSYT